MLSEVSETGPYISCTQKHYQPSRSTNFTNTTNSAMRSKKVRNTNICFTEVRIHCLLLKLLLKHSESYSPLRHSLGCESIPPHFHRVGSSSNHFPNSLSLFLPLRRRSATCTNFPQQPTQLDARRATPSRLGAKAPRVTNAKHMISAKLECSRFGVLFSALKLSLYQTQLKDVTRITQSHREIGES
jgi:hypothetical protein